MKPRHIAEPFACDTYKDEAIFYVRKGSRWVVYCHGYVHVEVEGNHLISLYLQPTQNIYKRYLEALEDSVYTWMYEFFRTAGMTARPKLRLVN